MIIRKMTAVFGRLDGETLELKDGINIISAPNESGKSTWCAFIRAMLYGIDTSKRERAGEKPDKIKYLPVSGAMMGGEMELSVLGRDITLSRTSPRANSPMQDFRAYYTGTAQPVSGIGASDAGLALTGVSREVFERSAFVGQSAVKISNSPKLEARIASIVQSHDTGTSYTQADVFLRKNLRLRRYNKSGALPRCEAEIEELESRLSEMEADTARRKALEDELSRAREERSQLHSRIESETRARAGEHAAHILALRDEKRRLEAELLEEREIQEHPSEKHSKVFLISAAALFISIILGIFLHRAFYALAVFCALAWLAAGIFERRKAAPQTSNQGKSEVARLLEDVSSQLSEVESALLRGDGMAHLGSAQLDGEVERLSREIALIDGRFSSLGDPAHLQAQLSSLREKRETLLMQYDCISLAAETLAEAEDELQSQFSPQLGERAGAIFSRLTDGKYDRLSFDSTLRAFTRQEGAVTDFDAALLSAGALDTLYLSLRLALCEMALPDGYSCPIILDDALCSLDDRRMGLALDYLIELSKGRQVIIFSCHEREKNYLARLGL